jgi:hypothetical protein
MFSTKAFVCRSPFNPFDPFDPYFKIVDACIARLLPQNGNSRSGWHQQIVNTERNGSNGLNEEGYSPNNDDRTRAHILAPRRVRFVSVVGFVIAVPYARSARFPSDESPHPGSRCAAPLAS